MFFMPRTRLYLMRHGQTDWNARAALQGRTDIPLNATGRAQAAAARTLLAGVAFNAVYSSPLCRAVETAELATGWPKERIQRDERLIEISFGPWEGCESRTLGPAFAPFFADPANYRPPQGGESLQSLMARTGAFAAEVLARHAGGTVLAASHGAALHALLTCALKRPMGEFWAANLGNCCVAVLESSGGPFHLKEMLGEPDTVYQNQYLK